MPINNNRGMRLPCIVPPRRRRLCRLWAIRPTHVHRPAKDRPPCRRWHRHAGRYRRKFPLRSASPRRPPIPVVVVVVVTKPPSRVVVVRARPPRVAPRPCSAIGNEKRCNTPKMPGCWMIHTFENRDCNNYKMPFDSCPIIKPKPIGKPNGRHRNWCKPKVIRSNFYGTWGVVVVVVVALDIG